MIYIFMIILFGINKIDRTTVNIYSKASTEYFEEFFICIFFIFLKSAINLKTSCYRPDRVNVDEG
jgi:hypothetical protein